MPNNFRHSAIADMIIACPHMGKGEIAYELGYTQAWLSTLISSDAFQMYLAQRRMEYESALTSESTARLHELDKAASKIIKEELESLDPCPNYALSVKKVLSSNMGNKAQLGIHIENMKLVQNNTQINQSVLERARSKMKRIEATIEPDNLIGEVLESNG